MLTALTAALAIVAPGHHHTACDSRACERRVGRKHTLRKWRHTVAPYRGWLDRTGACEADSSGGYRLTTNGNGFWFRYQFTIRTWASVGGRVIAGRPAGIDGEAHPRPLEQDYRAIRVLWSQGVGAWPVCGS